MSGQELRPWTRDGRTEGKPRSLIRLLFSSALLSLLSIYRTLTGLARSLLFDLDGVGVSLVGSTDKGVDCIDTTDTGETLRELDRIATTGHPTKTSQGATATTAICWGGGLWRALSSELQAKHQSDDAEVSGDKAETKLQL
jgi:hypothetical protein